MTSRFHIQSPSRYLLSLMAVGAATFCGLLVRDLLAPTNIAMIYLLAVVLSATSWGLGPSVFASVVAVLTFDILFVPPYGTLAVHDPQYFLTFGIFLTVAVIISQLGARVRAQIAVVQQREQQSAALYALTRGMAFVRDSKEILDTATQQVNQVFNSETLLLLLGSDQKLRVPADRRIAETARDAALWTFEHKAATGWSTRLFSNSEYLFLPLVTAHGIWGVLGLRPRAPRVILTPDQRLLLEMFVAHIAIAFEHLELNAQAEQARLLEASERFRNTLLSSISHDLRTPLAAILGSVTSLLDKRMPLTPSAQQDLMLTIEEEATRLNRLVGNLLNMTQVESGALKPARDWNSIEEVIGSALVHARVNGRAVQVTVDSDVPLVSFDFVLIEQVLLNLLDNALKFSPLDSPISIRARRNETGVQVSVVDCGIGIPANESQRVFEKFYRLPQNGAPGSGLGLAICKGIVEAHGGAIWAEPRAGGGTNLAFTLPAPELKNVAE
ncbi:MAG: DUF4118 domain-containing protein [Chloroflexi bacterium]|nr:DUF4118 domain-containing protein [Chloroflexota bacterium]